MNTNKSRGIYNKRKSAIIPKESDNTDFFLENNVKLSTDDNSLVRGRVARKIKTKVIYDPSDDSGILRKKLEKSLKDKERYKLKKEAKINNKLEEKCKSVDRPVNLDERCCVLCLKHQSISECISCRDCSQRAHLICVARLNSTIKVTSDIHWQCRDCQICNLCYETSHIDPLFKCMSCKSSYHLHCLELKTKKDFISIYTNFICKNCQDYHKISFGTLSNTLYKKNITTEEVSQITEESHIRFIQNIIQPAKTPYDFHVQYDDKKISLVSTTNPKQEFINMKNPNSLFNMNYINNNYSGSTRNTYTATITTASATITTAAAAAAGGRVYVPKPPDRTRNTYTATITTASATITTAVAAAAAAGGRVYVPKPPDRKLFVGQKSQLLNEQDRILRDKILHAHPTTAVTTTTTAAATTTTTTNNNNVEDIIDCKPNLTLLPNSAMSSDATQWSSSDVTNYFSKFFPFTIANIFKEQRIDGANLLLMTRSNIIECLNLKLGTALNIFSHVTMLQNGISDPRLTWF